MSMNHYTCKDRHCIAGNFGGAKFYIKAHKVLRNNFRVLIIGCAQIMPQP